MHLINSFIVTLREPRAFTVDSQYLKYLVSQTFWFLEQR